MSIPFITREQMENVDKLAIEKFDIKLLDMMERAGKGVADVVSSLRPKKVVVAYGRGHNGGGGLAAARLLLEKGFDVEVVGATSNLKEATQEQLGKLRELGVKENDTISSTEETVIVDALLGYGVNGNPEGVLRELINEINIDNSIVVSVDIPSGVDATSGKLYKPYVVADYTVTLALPKTGLQTHRDVVGKIYLADIGIPNKVYKKLGIPAGDYFEGEALVELG